MRFFNGTATTSDARGSYVFDMIDDGRRQIRVQAYEDWFVDKRVGWHEVARVKALFDMHKGAYLEKAVKEAVLKDNVWVYVIEE